jgi:hypothetical protein
MEAQEVAKAMSVNRSRVRALLKQANASNEYWSVPPPAGLTRDQPYWLRTNVARWTKAQDERQAERTRTPIALKRTPPRRRHL